VAARLGRGSPFHSLKRGLSRPVERLPSPLGYVGFRSIVDRHRNDIALVLPATAWSWQIAGAPGLAVEFSNGSIPEGRLEGKRSLKPPCDAALTLIAKKRYFLHFLGHLVERNVKGIHKLVELDRFG
jgi:hypothetical protein